MPDVIEQLGKLRAFIEDPASDLIAVRLAQVAENTLRWATETELVDWDDPLEDSLSFARIIRDEMKEGEA